MGVPVVLPPSDATGASVTGLAARLGITFTDQADVDRAAAAIEDAKGLVEGYIRGPLNTVTEDVTLDAPCGPQLWLPFRRVQSVSAVSIGATPLVSGGWTLRGDSLWRLYGWQQYAWSLNAPPTVTATVTHGFTDLPADIVGVIYALAVSSWQNPDGLRQFTITQGSKSEGGSYATETIGSGALGAGQIATLDRYRARRSTSVQLVKAC